VLTVKEAIAQRRSIRKFKPVPVPEEHITVLLDSARLAPSGCNAQPWRFKVVKDRETRLKLADASYGQSFIAEAPVVLVCCADVMGYLNGTVSGTQDLGKIGAIEDRVVEIILKRTDLLRTMSVAELGPTLALNVAIAIEHMALRALDFSLGTCWVRLIDGQKIKDLFSWDDNTLYVVALLAVGYPDESPAPRKRLAVQEIIID
jgi:nitroreductase